MLTGGVGVGGEPPVPEGCANADTLKAADAATIITNRIVCLLRVAVAPVHYNMLPIQPASRRQGVMIGLTTLFDQAGCCVVASGARM